MTTSEAKNNPLVLTSKNHSHASNNPKSKRPIINASSPIVASVRGRGLRGGHSGGRSARSRIQNMHANYERSNSTIEEDLSTRNYLFPAHSEADILGLSSLETYGGHKLHPHQKAISDWTLQIIQAEPIYDLATPKRPPQPPPRPPRPQNEHYYSIPPDAIQKAVIKKPSPASLSFTIKMAKKSEADEAKKASGLQSDLSDLNKLKSRDILSNENFVCFGNSDVTASTATSAGLGSLENFRKTRDFGDFQVLSSPIKNRPKTAV